eukprot:TRINITY_DN15086_c0_g1_i1.p1 TRINITY_DN15086_c0_g1~~TRINITY_DN15086_c0_g1_i1.p1  ORF type:complete len:550 (-),score=78.51 TRINITY_DN15086_c0_g1_i1:371-2020(-)
MVTKTVKALTIMMPVGGDLSVLAARPELAGSSISDTVRRRRINTTQMDAERLADGEPHVAREEQSIKQDLRTHTHTNADAMAREPEVHSFLQDLQHVYAMCKDPLRRSQVSKSHVHPVITRLADVVSFLSASFAEAEQKLVTLAPNPFVEWLKQRLKEHYAELVLAPLLEGKVPLRELITECKIIVSADDADKIAKLTLLVQKLFHDKDSLSHALANPTDKDHHWYGFDPPLEFMVDPRAKTRVQAAGFRVEATRDHALRNFDALRKVLNDVCKELDPETCANQIIDDDAMRQKFGEGMAAAKSVPQWRVTLIGNILYGFRSAVADLGKGGEPARKVEDEAEFPKDAVADVKPFPKERHEEMFQNLIQQADELKNVKKEDPSYHDKFVGLFDEMLTAAGVIFDDKKLNEALHYTLGEVIEKLKSPDIKLSRVELAKNGTISLLQDVEVPDDLLSPPGQQDMMLCNLALRVGSMLEVSSSRNPDGKKAPQKETGASPSAGFDFVLSPPLIIEVDASTGDVNADSCCEACSKACGQVDGDCCNGCDNCSIM